VDYWWVITIGFAGGFILASGFFFAMLQVRRARLRGAEERERLMLDNERRLTGLLGKTTAMSEELKLMSQELINVQEEERKRISRELHDEVGQILTAITLNLELMKKGLGPADERMLREKIGDTERLASEMFGRIRTFLGELRPAAIDDLGLAVVARKLLKDFTNRSGLRVEISGELDLLNRLGHDRRIAAYRLMQECLTNVVKHAHATTVRVAVTKAGEGVRIEIADDGDGFDHDQTAGGPRRRSGMGILGMRERMELVGGQFQMESVPGRGTNVVATMPLGDASARNDATNE
jgi:signal transduction histidine kinase